MLREQRQVIAIKGDVQTAHGDPRRVEVIDPVADYAGLLESLFDFDHIAGLLALR